jgi:hypothetical protein
MKPTSTGRIPNSVQANGDFAVRVLATTHTPKANIPADIKNEAALSTMIVPDPSKSRSNDFSSRKVASGPVPKELF